MDKEEWLQFPEELRKTVGVLFDAHGYDFNKLLESNNADTLEPSDWMTREEAAAYAKRSKDTIDNWCGKGFIEKSKLGTGKAGGVLISRRSLEKFIRSRIINHPKRVRKDYAPSVKGGYRV